MNSASISCTDNLMLLYIPIMVWTFLLIVYFFFLARKFTFGNWTSANPNPYCDETCGLPKGTFRGILTITITFVAVVLEIFTLENPQYEVHTAKFMTAFQMVIAFYFGSQVMNTLTNAETKKTQAISEGIAEASKGDDNNK